MINKLKSLKKLKYILPVTLVIGVVCIGLTLAYLGDTTETLTNKFTAGEVTTEIEEENPSAVNGYIEKAPKVINTGPNDCLVRMRVTISPDEFNRLLETESSGVSINYNKTAWTLGQDGFWYYNGILSSSEGMNSTVPLFSEISGLTYFNSEDQQTHVNNDYLEWFNDIEITLYQESVQSIVYDSNGDSISAYNEDGTYNQKNAKKIWDLYDNGLIDISTDS